MIISRTPLRISFAGGGSDLEAFYRHGYGAVVSTAINKYIYITVNRKFDHKIRASYSITEIADSVGQIKHELIRETLRMLAVPGAIEVTSISDVPSQGTGLGSSSSYTVGLLNAVHAYNGQFADASRLAQEACRIEIDICGKPIGKQDQYIAAYGGMQYIQFNADGTVSCEPVIMTRETRKNLQASLLMLYTGMTRSADTILKEQSSNTTASEESRGGLQRMVRLAEKLRAAIHAGDTAGLGEILHQGWLEKRKLATGISTTQIDDWYDRALKAGALGGKILGAGGGGFLLLCAPPERHERILHDLPELQPVPFEFEPRGSSIIFVQD
jgi:D-glycero-alpha-D-manno-heptose-7-phosphate kinase